MVYRLDAGTVIDADGNLQIENLYAVAIEPNVEWNGFGAQASFGYSLGGQLLPVTVNTIDKFSFSVDGNATDVGDLIGTATRYVAGQSSSTNGYAAGGMTMPTPSLVDTNVIQKFPFAVDENATDVGDLTQDRAGPAGQSSSENGYSDGGYVQPGGTNQNTIDKFPFAADANATDVGDLTQARRFGAGQSSQTHGYLSGAYVSTPVNTIDKFSFSTDGNATDVGDLTEARYSGAGASSVDNGYTAGGASPSTSGVTTIDKFPFAADANAADVGDLYQRAYVAAGQSSGENGYSAGGGSAPPFVPTNIIQKYPFSTDANSTDVGDLTQSRYSQAGVQG